MIERSWFGLGAAAVLVLILLATAQTGAAPRKREPAAPAQPPADKRDRVVAAPGTPFHGRAYWRATAQCGGVYFKLRTIYSESAIKAKVIKPDPAAYTQLSKSVDEASRAATAFFEAAERFLIGDRKMARDEAVMTYDAASSEAGDRAKTLDAALQAAKPCPDLYQTCRSAYPQVCSDGTLLTN